MSATVGPAPAARDRRRYLASDQPAVAHRARKIAALAVLVVAALVFAVLPGALGVGRVAAAPGAAAIARATAAEGPGLSAYELRLDPGTSWTLRAVSSVDVEARDGAVSVQLGGETGWNPIAPGERWGFGGPEPIDVVLRNDSGPATSVLIRAIGLPQTDLPGDIVTLLGQAPLVGPFDLAVLDPIDLIPAPATGYGNYDFGRDSAALLHVERGTVVFSWGAGETVVFPHADAGAVRTPIAVQVGAFGMSGITLVTGDTLAVSGGAAFTVSPASPDASAWVWSYQPSAALSQPQDAPVPVPATPVASDCVTAPLPADAVAGLRAAPATPVAQPGWAADLGSGEPIDFGTFEGLRQLYAQWLACRQAGEPARYLALTTERYRGERLTGEEVDAARGGGTYWPAGISPSPPGGWGTLLTADVATVLFDAGTSRDLVRFERVGGRWLIDDVIADWSPVGTGAPVAAACTAVPRSYDEIEAILNGTPAPTPPRYAPGDGEPADAEAVETFTATLDQLAACLGAGDVRLMLGMWAPAGMTVAPELVAQLKDEVASARAGVEYGGGTYTVNRVWDVRIQPDGRITGQVDFDGELALITIVQLDGRWLLERFDDQVELEPPAD